MSCLQCLINASNSRNLTCLYALRTPLDDASQQRRSEHSELSPPCIPFYPPRSTISQDSRCMWVHTMQGSQACRLLRCLWVIFKLQRSSTSLGCPVSTPSLVQHLWDSTTTDSKFTRNLPCQGGILHRSSAMPVWLILLRRVTTQILCRASSTALFLKLWLMNYPNELPVHHLGHKFSLDAAETELSSPDELSPLPLTLEGAPGSVSSSSYKTPPSNY